METATAVGNIQWRMIMMTIDFDGLRTKIANDYNTVLDKLADLVAHDKMVQLEIINEALLELRVGISVLLNITGEEKDVKTLHIILGRPPGVKEENDD
jgi:hypothetical protein